MNDTEKPCINGCIRKGTEDTAEPELLVARHGQYCARCWGRIHGPLGEAPAVVEHVISMLTSGGQPDVKVDGKADQAPTPFNSQAFDDANETYKSLVYWSHIVAAAIRANPPSPARASWRTRDGRIVGLPANIAPNQARYIVGVMSTWLRMHLDTYLFAALPAEVDALTDAMRDVYRISARWPRKSRPHYSDMPCPKDECTGKIAVWPPENPGDDEKIMCTGCGLILMPDQYEHFVLVFKQTQLERAQAAKVANHLMRKFA